jgi:hypothetical protein
MRDPPIMLLPLVPVSKACSARTYIRLMVSVLIAGSRVKMLSIMHDNDHVAESIVWPFKNSMPYNAGHADAKI